MLKAWKTKIALCCKCLGKGIHGAHVYYCAQGKTFSSYELMLLIASALFFRFYNPWSTLDFYGDAKTVERLLPINSRLHLYNHMNGTLASKKATELNILEDRFFNFIKFVALEDLVKLYNEAVCIIDTDLIVCRNLSLDIYKHAVCCTHYESLEESKIYPNYIRLHTPPRYTFPDICKKFNGQACNTSLLCIRDPKIALEYISEGYRFMSNNSKAEKPDLMWVEQTLFPLVAKQNKISVYAFINRIFYPNTGCFNTKNKDGTYKHGWAYDNLDVLNDEEFPIYHIWNTKPQLEHNADYCNYAVMWLFEYIQQFFPDRFCNKIRTLPELSEMNFLLQEYGSSAKAVLKGAVTDHIVWN